MTTVSFRESEGVLLGFTASGHSGYADEGEDIVCAAISSATLMAANTITEILQLKPDITANDDGFLSLDLSKPDAETARVVLEGLRLHLVALSQEYKRFLKVKISEV